MLLKYSEFAELIALFNNTFVTILIDGSGELCAGELTIFNNGLKLVISIGTNKFVLTENNTCGVRSITEYFFISDEKEIIIKPHIDFDKENQYFINYGYDQLCSSIIENIECFSGCEIMRIDFRGGEKSYVYSISDMKEKDNVFLVYDDFGECWDLRKDCVLFCSSRLFDSGVLIFGLAYEGELFIFKFDIAEILD